jgi:tetratricopeptide (TPR) repeat protein
MMPRPFLLGALLVAALSGALPGTSHAGLSEDRALLKEANKLLDDWQLEDAQAIAQTLLAKYPTEPGISLLASRVQHARGEYESALSLLEFAVAGGAEADILDGLIRSSGGYALHAATLETPHFKIRYLNKDEIVAHYLEDVIEAAYQKVGGALELLPAERGEKIVVEIYPNARGLSGATGLTIDEIETSGTIAVCKYHRLMIISPLATAMGYDWANTVAHEFIHLIISKKSHNTIPIWLHEGIAKFYESLWDGPAGRALKPYSEKLLAEAVRDEKLITFAQMHPSMAMLPSQEAAGLAFAEVFTVIEFLRKRYGARTVPRVLELAGSGVPLEDALMQVYKLDLKGVEKAWGGYIRKRPFKIFPGAKPAFIELSGREGSPETEQPLETIEDPEAQNFSRLGELLQLREHHKAAIVEYEKAHAKSEYRYPTLINRLARAYVADKRPREATALLEGLLHLHQTNADAHLLAGRLTLDQGDLQKAREHFEAVRMQNPFNPEIHAALAALYRKEGKSAQADRESYFMELARSPRTRSKFPPLELQPWESSSVSLIPTIWSTILVDGEHPVQAPRRGYSLTPGVHRVEYVLANGEYKTKEFKVGPEGDQTVILD